MIRQDIGRSFKNSHESVQKSVRNLLFCEVISNTLIHREYTNPYPAKFIIEKQTVKTENANRATGSGQLNPENFSPLPKNPVIARVFKEIGRADELSSGVRNIFKYYHHYSQNKPVLEEADVFKCIIHIDDSFKDLSIHGGSQTGGQIGGQISETQQLILSLIIENNKVSRREIAEKLKINESAIQKHINKLKQLRILERIGGTRGYWKINT